MSVDKLGVSPQGASVRSEENEGGHWDVPFTIESRASEIASTISSTKTNGLQNLSGTSLKGESV